jgi:hypothetical protein
MLLKRNQLKSHMYTEHDHYMDEYGQFIPISPTSLLMKMRKAKFTDCSLAILLGSGGRSGQKRSRDINTPKHLGCVELA